METVYPHADSDLAFAVTSGSRDRFVASGKRPVVDCLDHAKMMRRERVVKDPLKVSHQEQLWISQTAFSPLNVLWLADLDLAFRRTLFTHSANVHALCISLALT